jgi:AcrR family transcriptional regulator
MTTQPTRISKDERRRQIIDAAAREFAARGYEGTPVEAIAKRVGVTQPYLFQLFGTKKDLFIAAVRRGFERTIGAFRKAAADAGEGADPHAVLQAMGGAYAQLLDDRELLLMQMQAYVACGDADIRAAVQEELMRLVSFVKSASGATDEAVCQWLAYGMLMNVIAATDLPSVDADWARLITPCMGGPACTAGPDLARFSPVVTKRLLSY